MLTELVPIPPACTTSVTGPSPKSKVTLLIVPSESLPLAVNAIEKGAVPVAVRSALRVLQTGG